MCHDSSCSLTSDLLKLFVALQQVQVGKRTACLPVFSHHSAFSNFIKTKKKNPISKYQLMYSDYLRNEAN